MNRRSLSVVALCSFQACAFAQSQGDWETPFDMGPTSQDSAVAIHMIHTFDGTQGRILVHSRDTQAGCGSPLTRLWTPLPIGSPPGYPGAFEPVPLCRTILFCPGHAALADGTILHIGGEETDTHAFSEDANLFDPLLSEWNEGLPPQPPANMAYQRWYPTATTLPTGKVLVTSGFSDLSTLVPFPELYNPGTKSFSVLNVNRTQPPYPFMFVLPGGNVADAGPGQSRILLTMNWSWDSVIAHPASPSPLPPPPGAGSSAVMYEPGKIMRCGGADPANPTDPAVGTTWTVDLTQWQPGNSAAWINAGAMSVGRKNHNLVILPNGKVLAVGGNKEGDYGTPVHTAEIFDPASATWSPQPASHGSHHRWYHSTALLLPDGRVVSAGGDDHPTAQIFRPPYFDGNPPQAILSNAPAAITYEQEYSILATIHIEDVEEFDFDVVGVALIRLASTTHGFDMDQRYVPLEFYDITGFSFTKTREIMFTAPANANIAPPGYYMLWLLTETEDFPGLKVPCQLAAHVKVGT